MPVPLLFAPCMLISAYPCDEHFSNLSECSFSWCSLRWEVEGTNTCWDVAFWGIWLSCWLLSNIQGFLFFCCCFFTSRISCEFFSLCVCVFALQISFGRSSRCLKSYGTNFALVLWVENDHFLILVCPVLEVYAYIWVHICAQQPAKLRRSCYCGLYAMARGYVTSWDL